MEKNINNSVFPFFMEYNFSQKHFIRISGTPEEIREWLWEISNFMNKGSSYSALEYRIRELEKITDYEELPLGGHHRVCFKNNALYYAPNVSGEAAKEFHFAMFKRLFDEAKVKMDEKYKNK